MSISLPFKLLPAILSLIGASLAIYLYNFAPEFIINLTDLSLGKKLYTFLNGKYLFDVVYNNYVINGGLNLGYTISKVLDRGVIEMVGPYGLSKSFNSLAKDISNLDTGSITTYGLYIVLAMLSLVVLIFNNILFVLPLDFIRLFIILFFTLIVVNTK
jgi:NADH-ubiquinone oxidoreductase chain 5